MSLAFVYMATRVPADVGQLRDLRLLAERCSISGMNLPASMVRSAKTIGLMAGGAAGGPGAYAAVGAMTASAGLSAAASGLSSAASMATPSGGGAAGGESPRSADE